MAHAISQGNVLRTFPWLALLYLVTVPLLRLALLYMAIVPPPAAGIAVPGSIVRSLCMLRPHL